jgi:hypothetical protein
LFAKKDRANISDAELRNFRRLADLYARKTPADIIRSWDSQSLWRYVMTRNRRYKNEVFEIVHSAVEGRYRAGTIAKATMREFDVDSLVFR